MARKFASFFLLLWFFFTPDQKVFSEYTVSRFVDQNTGNVEDRFLFSGFHFASLIEDPSGRVIFRPRPDQADPNGFGTSWFINPFLSGADPGQSHVNNVIANSSGINLDVGGRVTRSGGLTYGNWAAQGTISYDPSEQRVFGSGDLNIMLDGTLSAAGADLNIERLSSNFLNNVPLQQPPGFGNTGDFSKAEVKYSPNGDSRDFTWEPISGPNPHFPQDFSRFLGITAVGDINRVDTLAQGRGFQIAVARKPTISLSYSSMTDLMIAGLAWDQARGQDFAADNIGINHLFTKDQVSSTNLPLRFQVVATVVPEPFSLTLVLLGFGGVMAVAHRQRKKHSRQSVAQNRCCNRLIVGGGFSHY